MTGPSEIETLVAEYCAIRPEIAACYLFGSQITGRARPDSDVDLGFLLDRRVREQEYFDLRLKYSSDLSGILHHDVDPVTLNDAGEVLLGQIFGKGKLVYVSDAEALRAFRRRKLPMIAEFSYYLDQRLARFRARYGGKKHG